MGRTAVGAIYAVVMVAVVVVMDLLVFRGHLWERLAANVGVVLLSIAFWSRFRGQS